MHEFWEGSSQVHAIVHQSELWRHSTWRGTWNRDGPGVLYFSLCPSVHLF